eukprot:gnl/TRDRNA2_/TRDRNA2_167071_c0_seq2.p1 gnl/TRDRNA2_/TRDRNA2_167071_c0~~gnl/TRDRNA2_/TRDRNA2_167071_c0_seq2.p1  ORF type:complete len:104 (-),score=3.08 gnl/TRDRNA2_/TRDRNA2_167071_c0_seq2:87-398(-)
MNPVAFRMLLLMQEIALEKHEGGLEEIFFCRSGSTSAHGRNHMCNDVCKSPHTKKQGFRALPGFFGLSVVSVLALVCCFCVLGFCCFWFRCLRVLWKRCTVVP